MNGEGHFQEALVASLAGDQDENALAEFRQALAEGIDPKKEILARHIMGEILSRAAARKCTADEDMVDAPEWLEAEKEYEAALRLDRTGNHGYFSEPLGRAQLSGYDLFCKIGGSAKGKKSPQAAIAYLESKVKLCDYLPTSPLIKCLLELGAYCYDLGDHQRATAWWQYLLSCAPVHLTNDNEDELKVRAHAEENIRAIQKKNGKAAPGAGCLLPLLAGAGVVMLLAAWGPMSVEKGVSHHPHEHRSPDRRTRSIQASNGAAF